MFPLYSVVIYLLRKLGDETLYIELAFAAVVVHVADLAENWSLFPSHVVHAADGPHAADVTTGISSVEAVLIVEVNGYLQSLFRILHPFEDLLSPVHAQEAVHLALAYQLALCRVPQIVTTASLLQLIPAQ